VSIEEKRWRLEDERDFLHRSLQDAELELAAGDLKASDFEVLDRRDRARLIAVESELAALDAPDEVESHERLAAGGDQPPDTASDPPDHADDPDPSGSSRGGRRLWLVAVGVSAIVAGVVLLVLHLSSPRLPGQPETGSIKVSSDKQVQIWLAQATDLVNKGTTSSIEEALLVYRQVLGVQPNQPEALAETGWLEWENAFQARDGQLAAVGEADVVRSLQVSPSFYAGHLFLGTIDLDQGNNAQAAVAQYRDFLSDHPPAQVVTNAAPLIRDAFEKAGVALPAGVPPG